MLVRSYSSCVYRGITSQRSRIKGGCSCWPRARAAGQRRPHGYSRDQRFDWSFSATAKSTSSNSAIALRSNYCRCRRNSLPGSISHIELGPEQILPALAQVREQLSLVLQQAIQTPVQTGLASTRYLPLFSRCRAECPPKRQHSGKAERDGIAPPAGFWELLAGVSPLDAAIHHPHPPRFS